MVKWTSATIQCQGLLITDLELLGFTLMTDRAWLLQTSAFCVLSHEETSILVQFEVTRGTVFAGREDLEFYSAHSLPQAIQRTCRSDEGRATGNITNGTGRLWRPKCELDTIHRWTENGSSAWKLAAAQIWWYPEDPCSQMMAVIHHQRIHIFKDRTFLSSLCGCWQN